VWHTVRLLTIRSLFSEVVIAVDISIQVAHICVLGAADALTWRENAVMPGASRHLALWIEGCAENADRNNVRVYWEQRRLPVEFVSGSDTRSIRQVNVPRASIRRAGPCCLPVQDGNALRGGSRLGDALAFAISPPSWYGIRASPNQLAPREPPGGSLAISSDRTQHGKD
jgi:hypothetical protein